MRKFILTTVILALILSAFFSKSFASETDRIDIAAFIPERTIAYINLDIYEIKQNPGFKRFIRELQNTDFYKKFKEDFIQKDKTNLSKLEQEELLNLLSDISEISITFLDIKKASYYHKVKARKLKEKRWLQICNMNKKLLLDGISKSYQDNSKYPENLEMLIPKYIKTIPECPADGKYIYKVNPELGEFELYCQTHKDSFYTPYNIFEENLEGLIIIRFFDVNAAKKWLDRVEEKAGVLKKKKFCNTFINNYLILADTSELLKEVVEIYGSGKNNLKDSKIYQDYKTDYLNSQVSFFIKLDNNLSGFVSNELVSQALKELKCLEGGLKLTHVGIYADMKLLINPARKNKFIRKILTAPEKSRQFSSPYFFSQKVPLYLAVDAKKLYDIFLQVIKFFPEAEKKFISAKKMVDAGIASQVGLDLETIILNAFTGEVALGINKIDKLIISGPTKPDDFKATICLTVKDHKMVQSLMDNVIVKFLPGISQIEKAGQKFYYCLKPRVVFTLTKKFLLVSINQDVLALNLAWQISKAKSLTLGGLSSYKDFSRNVKGNILFLEYYNAEVMADLVFKSLGKDSKLNNLLKDKGVRSTKQLFEMYKTFVKDVWVGISYNRDRVSLNCWYSFPKKFLIQKIE